MERMQRMDVSLCPPASLGRAHPCVPGSSRLCCRSPERPRKAAVYTTRLPPQARLPQRRLPPSPVLAYLSCSHYRLPPGTRALATHASQYTPCLVPCQITSRSTPAQPRPAAPPAPRPPSARTARQPFPAAPRPPQAFAPQGRSLLAFLPAFASQRPPQPAFPRPRHTTPPAGHHRACCERTDSSTTH